MRVQNFSCQQQQWHWDLTTQQYTPEKLETKLHTRSKGISHMHSDLWGDNCTPYSLGPATAATPNKLPLEPSAVTVIQSLINTPQWRYLLSVSLNKH